MLSYVTRIISAWKRYGAKEFVSLFGKNLHYVLGRLFTGREAASSIFDRNFGTETAEIREIGTLGVESKNARYAVRYEPSPSQMARDAIQALRIPHDKFDFIDYGAGKGRVLLIAAEFPFKRIIGVEFSPELCSIAHENVAIRQQSDQILADVECLCADAAEFCPPDSPLVCYFYNPFDVQVMSVVQGKLRSTWLNRPRDIYVIYVHPKHRELFEQSDMWSVIWEEDWCVIFKAGQAPT